MDIETKLAKIQSMVDEGDHFGSHSNDPKNDIVAALVSAVLAGMAMRAWLALPKGAWPVGAIQAWDAAVEELEEVWPRKGE